MEGEKAQRVEVEVPERSKGGEVKGMKEGSKKERKQVRQK